MSDAPPADAQSDQDLVVVGASAGGIEALSRLVATLTPDFPAPIVIAQHLEPSRGSHLGEILGRRSGLPVRSLDEHEALAPGVVYVVPANRDVEITDHAISLSSDQPGRPKPSIDLLLTSAAQVFGERLIAVILTGTGSDGAERARRVKEAGGTVVVQNPETAQFPQLPRSLAPTTVDIVVGLEAIGPLLRDLLLANHELTTSNAELRSQNEELLLTNEEAQAAMEEVEPLSEEQQASNEELETLNEELQATIEELDTTNDDLEALVGRVVAFAETLAQGKALRLTLPPEPLLPSPAGA